MRKRIFYIEHGLTRHPVYGLWRSIKQRCYNPNASNYKFYGARGIKMYPPWKVDFVLFYEYIISLPNYGEKNLTLDRINNNDNYEPGNLRWVTQHYQICNSKIRKSNTSGYKGVSFYKGKYRAQICIKGICIYFGQYKTPKEAVKVRDQYIKDHNLKEYPLQILL